MFSGNISPLNWGDFARSAQESAHPNLWDNLIGAWVPALGPTSGIVYDISGRGKHATFHSSLDPAIAWAVPGDLKGVGYAIEMFDNNNRIEVISSDFPIEGITVVQYLFNSSAGNYEGMSYGIDSSNGFDFRNASDSVRIRYEIGSGTYYSRKQPNLSLNNDQWYSTAFTAQPTVTADSDLQVFVDGLQVDTGADSDNPFQPNGELWIGANFNNSNPNTKNAVSLYYDRILTQEELYHLAFDPIAPFRLAATPTIIPSITAPAGNIATLKTLNTSPFANIKTINTAPIANVKTANTAI